MGREAFPLPPLLARLQRGARLSLVQQGLCGRTRAVDELSHEPGGSEAAGTTLKIAGNAVVKTSLAAVAYSGRDKVTRIDEDGRVE